MSGRRRAASVARRRRGGGAARLPAAAAAQLEPVELSVSAPALVVAKEPIKVGVEVAAEPGALDIAAQPLRLRVALEPECGGSFAGTAGPIVIDREIPAPSPGAAYEFTGTRARSRSSPYGPETVCAFLEDSQERQFATSTEAVVDVSKACTLATRRLARPARGLRGTRAGTSAGRSIARPRRASHRKRAACRRAAEPAARALRLRSRACRRSSTSSSSSSRTRTRTSPSAPTRRRPTWARRCRKPASWCPTTSGSGTTASTTTWR